MATLDDYSNAETITLQQAAELLGMGVSTLYRLAADEASRPPWILHFALPGRTRGRWVVSVPLLRDHLRGPASSAA